MCSWILFFAFAHYWVPPQLFAQGRGVRSTSTSVRATPVTMAAPVSTNQTVIPATVHLGGWAPAVKSVSHPVYKRLCGDQSKTPSERLRVFLCVRPAVEARTYRGLPDQHAPALPLHHHRSAVRGVCPHAHHPHCGHLSHQPHRVPGLVTPRLPGVLQLPQHRQRVQQRHSFHPPRQVRGHLVWTLKNWKHVWKRTKHASWNQMVKNKRCWCLERYHLLSF